MSEKHLSPKGHSWDEIEKQIYTPEEIVASDLRVAKMVELANARAETGAPQQKLEKLIGPQQPSMPSREKNSVRPPMDMLCKGED